VTNEDECLGPGDLTQQLGTGVLGLNVKTGVNSQSLGRLCIVQWLPYKQLGFTLKILYSLPFCTIRTKTTVIS